MTSAAEQPGGCAAMSSASSKSRSMANEKMCSSPHRSLEHRMATAPKPAFVMSSTMVVVRSGSSDGHVVPGKTESAYIQKLAQSSCRPARRSMPSRMLKQKAKLEAN